MIRGRVGQLNRCRVRSSEWRHPTLSEALCFDKNSMHFQGLDRLRPFRFRYGSTFFSSTSSADVVEPVRKPKKVKSITLEEQYVRKTPLEHVLLRPGMYVGANERLPPSPCWVLDPLPLPPTEEIIKSIEKNPFFIKKGEKYENDTKYLIKKRECGFVPALIKVFDEILVNASDNRFRSDSSCTRIDVIIDKGDVTRDPFICVINDGKGIPVSIHKHEQMYIPELVFGHLLTGSNFDDEEGRLTGGRHGYGAKLTNIFSKSFTVETLDSSQNLKYRKTWLENMTTSVPAVISPADSEQLDYTCVSFVPDLPRLTGNPSAKVISDEDYSIMCRRAVDVAGCSNGNLEVSLNGVILDVSSFDDYCKLYRSPETPPLAFYTSGSRWTVGVGVSESGSFESSTFVNNIATSRGGTHVNALMQQITKHIIDDFKKRKQDVADFVTPALIRRNTFLICSAEVVNPSFDSQMKESLTSSPSAFGSSCTLSNPFLNSLLKTKENGGPGILEAILRHAAEYQHTSLLKDFNEKKSKRQLSSIPKLEDAHNAGTNKGGRCTLILTEGDSAKALAVAGLEVIGRETFGVFPLRGKLLNVRHASANQISNNVEIKALCAILGLSFDKTYETTIERNELRYGNVMLMTDQDTDGSHIKGLVVNFFRHFWPMLLQPPIDNDTEDANENSFLSFFITPLLKATKKGTKKILSFYSTVEFNAWRDKLEHGDQQSWSIKYYKGLGTSTPTEAKEYFKAFNKHRIRFNWNSKVDGDRLDMAFDKDRASDRREWLLSKPLDVSNEIASSLEDKAVSYEDFIDKELIHFSNADNIRSIPSVIDGLKPSQRKVLYACFKKRLSSEIKVAQLSGYCAENTAYHHGEASLQSTIIGMAQDFVGANNLNLLVPSGQFGTRLAGGADAASPRYIYTRLDPIARCIFPEADDILLHYQFEDGQKIEPEFFCPIIPLLLVNGCQGIGTGWSTFIPPYNPQDLIKSISAKLDDLAPIAPLSPFAIGFEGMIAPDPKGSGFVTFGRAKKLSEKAVLIDELPLRMWTSKYKEHLLNMRNKGLISNFVENHTTTKVSFTVTLKPNQLHRMEKSGLDKSFKLMTFLPTSNMYAFDAENKLRKFETAEDIIDEFFDVRLKMYHHRKSVLESELNYSAMVQRNKARFIESVAKAEIDLLSGKRTKEQTVHILKGLGFSTLSELQLQRNDNTLYRRKEPIENEILTIEEESVLDQFDYLLNMPLSSMTAEKITELRNEAQKKEKELEKTASTTAYDLWRHDLERLARHL